MVTVALDRCPSPPPRATADVALPFTREARSSQAPEWGNSAPSPRQSEQAATRREQNGEAMSSLISQQPSVQRSLKAAGLAPETGWRGTFAV